MRLINFVFALGVLSVPFSGFSEETKKSEELKGERKIAQSAGEPCSIEQGSPSSRDFARVMRNVPESDAKKLFIGLKDPLGMIVMYVDAQTGCAGKASVVRAADVLIHKGQCIGLLDHTSMKCQ